MCTRKKNKIKRWCCIINNYIAIATPEAATTLKNYDKNNKILPSTLSSENAFTYTRSLTLKRK